MSTLNKQKGETLLAHGRSLTSFHRVNNLVRLDPVTGEVEEFPIPFSLGLGNATIPGLNGAAGGLIQDRLALSCAIRPGADGKIYATNGNPKSHPRSPCFLMRDSPRC